MAELATQLFPTDERTVGPHRGERLRVWVDDRHPVFRRGLLASLAGGEFEVVGESAGLTPTPDPRSFDVLVFEADRPLLRRATQLACHRPLDLVAILDTATEELAYEMVDAGVKSLLIRADLRPSDLVSSLRCVADGTASLPAGLVPRLLTHASRRQSARDGVTDREREVLRLLAEGEDTRQIADGLCYSQRTVKNIVHDVLTKMNCTNRVHAVAVAIRHGII